MKVDHRQACKFADKMLASRRYEIHRVLPEIEREALKLFKNYHDKRLSFTDCTSFVLMKRFGINSVFTFDDDFAQVGFTKLPNF